MNDAFQFIIILISIASFYWFFFHEKDKKPNTQKNYIDIANDLIAKYKDIPTHRKDGDLDKIINEVTSIATQHQNTEKHNKRYIKLLLGFTIIFSCFSLISILSKIYISIAVPIVMFLLSLYMRHKINKEAKEEQGNAIIRLKKYLVSKRLTHYQYNIILHEISIGDWHDKKLLSDFLNNLDSLKMINHDQR